MVDVKRLFQRSSSSRATPTPTPGPAGQAEPEPEEPSLVSRGLRALYDTRRALDPNTHIFETVPRFLWNKGVELAEEAPEMIRGAARTAGGMLEQVPGAPESLAEFGAALRAEAGPAPPEPAAPNEPSQADFRAGIEAATAANAERFGTPEEIGQKHRGDPADRPATGRNHPAYVGPKGAASIMRAAGTEFSGSPDWGIPTTRRQAAVDDAARSEIAQRHARRLDEIEALAPKSPMEKAIEAETLEAQHDAVADRGNLYAGFDQEGNLATPGSFYRDPSSGTIRNIPGAGRRDALGEEGRKQARVQDVMAQIEEAQDAFEQERAEIEERQREISQDGGYDADGVIAAQLDRAQRDLERREAFAREFFDRMLAGLDVDVDAFYRRDEVDPVDAVIAGMLARDNP